jgi:YfiH family protein
MTSLITGDLNAPHGFFTRVGGVSKNAYESLNCGMSGQDNPDHVAENRARAVSAIGADPSTLVGLKQIHGARVVTVTAPWAIAACPAADAMVTNVAGVALGIITADCAPVLFADLQLGIVGAAHAGWRGALAGVLEATAQAMHALGAKAITAVIGPCIHPESYEVGRDLFDAITTHNPEHVQFLHRSDTDHWQFDLPGYAAARLAAIGIKTTTLLHDTYAEQDLFFSHRRRTKRAEGPGGHQISIIRIAS